jgi:hypothetical protein
MQNDCECEDPHDCDCEELQAEELQAEELQALRDAAMNCAFPKGWVWDEEKISYVPPFPPPDEKYPYLWNEETLAWDPFPGYPRDE